MPAPLANIVEITGTEDSGIAIGGTLLGLNLGSIASVSISGLPTGATLSSGLNLNLDPQNIASGLLDGLMLNLPENYSGNFPLTATVKLVGGLITLDTGLNVSITGLNDAPSDIVVVGAPPVASENGANGTLVASLSASDPDVGDSLTWSLTDDAGGRFSIDDSGHIRIADGLLLDFEQAASHTVMVRATDTSGASTDRALSIGITDVNPETIVGDGRANTFYGGAGNDSIDGGAGADRMVGGAGSDTYYVDNVGDRAVEANGAVGTDLVYASVSYALGGSELENLTLTGTGNLYGRGNSIANTLTGNGGANVLDGKGGADTMIGGAGSDTYYVDNAGDRCVEANGAAGTDHVYASVSYALGGSELENLTLTGTGNLYGRGNSIANTLIGNGGANALDGKGGADTMIGGAGSDAYYVDNVGDRCVEANGAAGTDHVYASVSYSLGGSELENLTLTGTGNLNGTGNSIANILIGNGGANVLDGKGGADRMIGGAGSDTYHVDNVGDRCVEANGAAGTDLVYASVSYSLGGSELENLTLTGAGNLKGTGNSIANTLTGTSGANVLDGRGGADILIGGAGSDTFVFATDLGPTNVDHLADFSAAADTIHLARSIFSSLARGELAETAFKDLSLGHVDADDRILYDKDTGALSYDSDGSGAKAAIQFAVIDTKATLTHADFFVV